ncbi:MAG: DUF2024 family protein [Flavobacteriales bacterium]|nr:DUF2024 family protein [Flavobacteriales bacterium]
MKVSVWDTYVNKQNGSVMHFDILVPSKVSNDKVVFDFGMNYLKTKPFKTAKLTTNECRFCHIEQATERIQNQIKKNGYFIIEMENCN